MTVFVLTSTIGATDILATSLGTMSHEHVFLGCHYHNKYRGDHCDCYHNYIMTATSYACNSSAIAVGIRISTKINVLAIITKFVLYDCCYATAAAPHNPYV